MSALNQALEEAKECLRAINDPRNRPDPASAALKLMVAFIESQREYSAVSILKQIYLLLAHASEGTVDPDRALDIATRAVAEACDNREGK